MKKIALVFSTLFVVSACGAAGAANVAACKNYYATLKCGSTDLSSQSSICEQYLNTPCDISPYFDCTASHYVCTNGQYDSEKLKSIGECSSKAACK